MIRISRGSCPQILVKKAKAWLKALTNAKSQECRKRAQEKYQHREIKDALVDMFHGKCAYCESQIRHIEYGHIEHFRPKSRFLDLSFEWTNLYLACGKCNGVQYKGDRFPDSSQDGPLVDPCEDDPNQHFRFMYDKRTQRAYVYGTTPRGEVTEKLLGLNRQTLLERRSSLIRKLVALKKLAQQDPEARAILNEARQDSAEYAAFARLL